jgi:hypothetical protein
MKEQVRTKAKVEVKTKRQARTKAKVKIEGERRPRWGKGHAPGTPSLAAFGGGSLSLNLRSCPYLNLLLFLPSLYGGVV